MSDRFESDPYGPLVDQAASAYGVDPSIIRAILHRESAGNPNAVSPAGAGGLMQLMPATAAGLGVTDRFDPAQNIDAGTRYYRQMLDRFGGDPQLALAAYNAGPGRVDRHLATGAALPAETRAYVPAVLARAGQGGQRAVDPMSLLPPDAQIIGGEADPMASLPPDAVILDEKAAAKPKDAPGVLSTFGTAAARGAGEAIRNTVAAPSFSQDRPEEAKAPDGIDALLSTPISEGWSNPKWWAAQIGAGIGGSAPSVAAGLIGGAAGTTVGGPAGTLVGSALGFGGGSFVQSLAPEYKRARAEGLDHDAAVDRALQQSGIAGAFGAAMGLAPGVGLFGKSAEGALKRPISEALAQIFGVQPALGVGQRATQNAAAGRETTAEELLQDYALNAGTGAAMVTAHKGVERMARRGARPEEAATPAAEDAQPDAEQPLALPAPRTQGEGFVMGDQPEVRQAQAEAQRFSDEMDAVQQAMAAAQTPEDRAALVERWTAARDGYTAARNRLDNLMPEAPRPEGVQPPPASEPLPPRNLPDIYRGESADPAMAALPPDAVLLGDAGRPAQIGEVKPAGLLEAPRGVQFGEDFEMRGDGNGPPVDALPKPEVIAGNGFTLGSRQADLTRAADMQARADEIPKLQTLIDRRTREMGALQKQIAAEVDPAERARKTNLFRQKTRQVEDARARLGELQPQEAARDVQEVQAPPRGRDEAAQPMAAETPVPAPATDMPPTPQPGDRVRVTNAKTGGSYEATLTGERGPRTLVTRDDGKKLQPLTSAHSIEPISQTISNASAPRGAPLSLFQFLASKGGIQDQRGELRAMDLHRTFVPGKGKLVRPNGGLTLDRARELAEEAGYLRASDRGDRFGRTEINDLLEVLRAESFGRKVYPEAMAPERQAPRLSDQRAMAEEGAASFARSIGVELNDREAAEATRLMVEHGLTADDAVERAMIREGLALVQEADRAQYGGEEIPFDDIQQQRGGRSGAEAAAEGERREGQPRPAGPDAGAGREAGARERAPEERRPLTEVTDQGEQALMEGVRPITDRDRAELGMSKPMQSKRSQRPMDEGLFDVGGRGQGDLFRLTDEAERAAPALEADLRAQLKRYGIDDRVGFRLVDAIRDRQTGEPIVSGGRGATGRYSRRIIEVALGPHDQMATLNHEVVHAIRELGLLTQKEWDALKTAADRDDGVKMANVRRRYKGRGLGEEGLYEEAVADLFADWQAGRRDAGAVQALLERIRDFIAAVGQVLRGQGFTTPEAVFRKIASGEIGGRPTHEISAARRFAEAFEQPRGTDERFALAPNEQALADAILAEQPSLAERIKKVFTGNRSGLGSEAVRQLVNQFEPIFQAEMRAEKQATGKAHLRDARISAAKMTELAVQDSGRLESMLVEGPLKWNATEGIAENVKGIGGLLDIFKPLKNADDYKRFSLYAIARRAQRLKAEGRENLLSDAQIAEGLKLESPEFKKVFDGYQRFNKAMLDFAVDTGVIKASSRDIYASGMDYIPFYRVAEETGELPPPATLAKLSNPDPKIRKLEGGTDKIGDLAENVVRNATALAKAGMRNEAMRRIHGVLEEIGEAKNLTAADEKAGSVAFFDKGTKRHFIAEDPAMMAAMAGLRPEQQAGIYKALAGFSNVLRRGVTASPGFMLANFIRDSASAYIQTGGTLSLANNGLTGLLRAAKKADSVKELKTIAGVGGYEFGHGARDIAAEMKRRLGVEVATTPKAILDKVLRPLEEVGSWTEVANRDAIYRNLLAEGKSKAEAAYQALNLLNFSRKGANQSLRFMLPLVPFLNARIQGLYRLAETQGDKAALKGVFLRGLMLTGVSAALQAAFGDDDKVKDAPIERRLNYYIVPAGDSTVLIPKPFEFGAIFSTMPEFLFDAIRKEDGDDLAKATAMTFLNTFSFNPVPQAVRPALEAWTNYDFFTDRPIEGPQQQKLAPGERADARTNATLKALGRETNISPMQAEHLISGYLGTLGQMTLAGMDAIMGASGAVPSKPAGAFGSVPVISPMIESAFGRFYKEGPDAANRWVGDFYDLKRRADETFNTIRKLREEGEVDRAREMKRDNAGLVAARKQLTRMGDQIGGLNRQINDVRADDEMSPEEKRQKMDALIARRNAIARRTAAIVEKIKARRSASVEDEAA